MAIFSTDGIHVRECYLRRTSASWRHARHVHDELNELFLVLKGCLSVTTPRGNFEARANQAVVYPKGLAHLPSSHGNEDLEVIGMAWTGKVLGWDAGKLVQYDSLGRLRHQLMWMLDSTPGGEADGELVLDLLGRSVLLEFNRLCAGEDPDMIVRVRRFMRENLERPLGLEELARAAGLNRCYFARAFKKAAGESPMRALAIMRMEAARDLILHTTLPLKNVASQTGFADEAHMSHAFKRLVGRSPGSLRRRGRYPE